MNTSTHNRRTRQSGRRLCATLSTMAIVAAGASLAPASATVGPAGIDPGINISVFHNIDLVATFGWPAGQSVTVDVLRNDVVIGTATGAAFDTPDGGALEVNHGPEGTPLPGDCWDGHTPDIRPGDLVRVTSGASVNEVIVDNISLTGASFNVATDNVEVRGIARSGVNESTAIPVGELNSGEFRTLVSGEQFRATPETTVEDPLVPGGFVMLYGPPYTGDIKDPAGVSEEQRRLALLNDDGHAAGFGHVAPLPDESMLVEGFGDASGPAPGCEGSPAAQDAVTSTNVGDVINRATPTTGNLEIAGTAFQSDGVEVTVGGLGPITANLAGAGDQQTWTASVPMSQVLGLPDGNITISMSSDRAGTPIAGASKVLLKDLVALRHHRSRPTEGTSSAA